MAFTPEHDQWVKEGLINATFTLHVLPMGRGFHQWGHVEELPVDVYYCDFEQYDPPAGFPRWDVCCVRTNAAWWVVLTEPLFVQLAILSQDGQLPQEFFHTITFLNERHIGAWLWVRDRGLSGDEALAKMDQRMIDRYGENYRAVKEVLDREVSVEGSKASMMFGRDLFLHEPMVTEGVQKEVLDYHRRSEPTGRESGVSRWGRKGKQGWQELLSSSVFKWASVLVFLILVLMVEGPRTRTIARRVYGPVQVDLEEHFPAIEWSDYTGESLWDDPVIAQALHQALVWRNPYLASTPIQSIKVAKLRQNSMTSIYRWTVVSDEMAEDHQTRVDMEEFSGRQLRALQNAVSGYKSLHLILCSKLILLWGGNGRFIVLFTAMCGCGLILLIMRLVRRVKVIEVETAVRNAAAGSKILEAVAQDKQAAENLMLFNQDRRLQMSDGGPTEAWEREAFDWVEQNIDLETGQTRRAQREETLKKKHSKDL